VIWDIQSVVIEEAGLLDGCVVWNM
jgi:hypothetical protein